MGRGCTILRYFSVPQSVKTDPGTYPSFYPIGVMRLGPENDSLPLPFTEVRKAQVCTSIYIYYSALC